ncbi:unnamed protein product [Orchesella dallaii]|uniref:Protein kinase domain-containing protein n=1 Tax=Orchesella dallaii TaxID=48710 RepID=A0ABP1Q3R7_9HEXA
MSSAIQKILLLTMAVIEVSSIEQRTGNGDPGTDPFLSIQNVVISLSMLCIFILVAVGCTWGWWQRVLCFWKTRGTHEAPPDWFVPGGSTNFRTLDPVNLQRDVGGRTSITIEPLPTMTDLNIDSRDSFELRTFRAPGIVPASNEEEIQSQDWFEEQHQSFPRKNLVYQKIIGKGWFGKVLEAEAKQIKPYIRVSNVIVRSLRDNATEQEQSRFLNEARMFRDAQDSDHILKLLGHCVDEMPYILIFEYFPLGDLKSYLRGKAKQVPSSADDGVIVRMIIDIVRGVKWMEQAGFVHGDLAARNCIVTVPAGKVVIGDYGCSTQKFRDDYYWTSGYAIPIRWAAPETVTFIGDSLSISKVTHVANIWSLGVLIWEVFQFGKTPYANLTDEDVIKRVLRNKSYILDPPQFPFVKESTKEKLYQLLVSCWNSVPNHRPSIDYIEEVFTTP